VPISLMMILSTGLAYGEIYKWVDGAGRVYYSDSAPNDSAERIELSKPTIYSPPAKRRSSTASKTAKNEYKYNDFSVTYPINRSTIRIDETGLIVTFSADPPLLRGDSIQLILDGKILPVRIASLTYLLEKLDRGTHFLQSSILGKNGLFKKRAKVIQFFVRKDTVLDNGDAPEVPESGDSGDSKVDAPQFTPSATSDFKGDTVNPGMDNPGYTPGGGGISHTPGQSNPSFKPKY